MADLNTESALGDLDRYVNATYIQGKAIALFGGDFKTDQERQRAFEAAACAAVWLGVEIFGTAELSARLEAIAKIMNENPNDGDAPK